MWYLLMKKLDLKNLVVQPLYINATESVIKGADGASIRKYLVWKSSGKDDRKQGFLYQKEMFYFPQNDVLAHGPLNRVPELWLCFRLLPASQHPHYGHRGL